MIEEAEVMELDEGPSAEVGEFRESFEACYARLFQPMRRVARLLVDTDEQATDVVQEAFSRLYPRFDRVTNLDAYLRATVLNEARRIIRRTIPHRNRVRPEPLADGSPHDHVADAIRALPLRQAHAVVLRYYLQMSDEDIATTLNMRVGTVKSTLHRAREQLKKDLLP